MADNKALFKKINELIDGVYASTDIQGAITELGRTLEIWDNMVFQGKEFEADTIFTSLQNLKSFFEKKGDETVADKVSKVILEVFPELCFPELPAGQQQIHVNTKPLEDVAFILKFRGYPDETQEKFRLFRERVFDVLKNVPLFVEELDRKNFSATGSGNAGELFRKFIESTEQLQNTELINVPWEVLLQIANKLNSEKKAYFAAYSLVKGLNGIKNVFPPNSLKEELKRSEIFFQRNYYWELMDSAMATQSYGDVVFYVDRLLPLADSAAERSNLLVIKNNALKKSEGLPKGCILIALLLFFGALFFASKVASNRSKNKTGNVFEKMAEEKQKKKKKKKSRNVPYRKGKKAVKKPSKTGLRETVPPLRPHTKNLTLEEVRYAVFQKQRLDFLLKMDLSPEEYVVYKKLVDEYKKRCEIYKYNPKDREKVDWELKIHILSLKEDAREILKDIRKELGTDEEDAQEDEEDSENDLLSTRDDVAVEQIQLKLKELGFFDSHITGVWDEETRKAILKFKIEKFSVLDEKWDLETQKKLFGK